MCGLTGYIDKTHLTHSTDVINKMMTIQKHRGPDDSGVLVINRNCSTYHPYTPGEICQVDRSADLYFGFNRLSILDLSYNGHQPMISYNSKVVIMMNGEVYNAFDFKAQLLDKGYVLRGTSDTEIVLNLYVEYGIETMLKMLNGMFAITIYDIEKKLLFLARDRFGIKPLYIYRNEKYFAFSSEIKSFLRLPQVNLELEESNLDSFLMFRSVMNKTLFKNIVNMAPGTYLTINHCNEEKVCVFHDFKRGQDKYVSSSTSNLNVADAMLNAVRYQMISDVKLGCQLSGGIDSSLITYFASRLVKGNSLETVSIVFNDMKFSEESYVDQVTQQLSLKSNKYTLDANYYFDNLENVTWHLETPINHPNTIGLYQLSQNAKKHVTVLLSGEGADEVFGGYDKFINLRKNFLLDINMLKKLKYHKNSKLEFLYHYFKKEKRFILGSSFISFDNLLKLQPNFNVAHVIQKRLDLLYSIEANGIEKYRRYEILSYLPDLLMRQDKMSMAHGIENRVPFLDNDLVDLALSMSDEQILGQKATMAKAPLKKICSDVYGDKFTYRPKMGFGIPLKEFYKTRYFNELWNDKILPKAKQRGIFNLKLSEKIINDISNSSVYDIDEIWMMTCFETWAQQYLDK